MKKNIALFIIVIVTFVNSIVPIQSIIKDAQHSEIPIALVGQNNTVPEVVSEWMTALQKDGYSKEELKDMYALFKGSEMWINKTNASGSNDTQAVLNKFSATQKALNIVFASECDLQLEKMFAKYEADTKSFEEAKSSIAKDMLYVANSIESSL